jgi:hypothetical protein
VNLSSLHDSILSRITLDWPNAELTILFRTGTGDSDTAIICAKNVTDIRCPRQFPWGPSSSVNEVDLKPEGNSQSLAIEMQSGDIILVICETVSCERGVI